MAIGAVYALRGFFLPLEILRYLRAPAHIPQRELAFSAVALATGLLYLVNTISAWRTMRARAGVGDATSARPGP